MLAYEARVSEGIDDVLGRFLKVSRFFAAVLH
jgi:hypothetical protein